MKVVVPMADTWREFLQTQLLPEYDPRAVLDYQTPIAEDREFGLQAMAGGVPVRVNEARAMAGFDPLTEMEGGEYFVAIRMRPDAYAGPDGSPTNYINFDMEAAQRLKLNLDRCIAEYHRLLGDASTRGDDVRRDHR